MKKLPKPETVARIREVMERELKVEGKLVTNEATLLEDLDADSLDVTELVMNLEDEFEVTLREETLLAAAQKEQLDGDMRVGTLAELIEMALERPDKTV